MQWFQISFSFVMVLASIHGINSQTSCRDMDGGGWTLVRHLSAIDAQSSLHPATDDLAGTSVYGVSDNNETSDETWSIQFNNIEHNQFMFSLGDCSDWLITRKCTVTSETYKGLDRCILASGRSENPYTAIWYYRGSSHPEDPLISSLDHLDCVARGSDYCMLYGEAVAVGNSAYANSEGANVWIRQKDDETRHCQRLGYADICSYIAPASGDLTYANAEAYCQSNYGTNLATISSATQNSYVRVAATNAGYGWNDVWIGLDDLDAENVWDFWNDGTPVTYTNWGELNGEQMPNNAANSEHCVMQWTFVEDESWNDANCQLSRPIVCNAYNYVYPTVNPSSSPSDLPSQTPSDPPSVLPSDSPSYLPTTSHSFVPSSAGTSLMPTDFPSAHEPPAVITSTLFIQVTDANEPTEQVVTVSVSDSVDVFSVKMIAAIGGAVILLLICVLCFLCYLMAVLRKNENDEGVNEFYKFTWKQAFHLGVGAARVRSAAGSVAHSTNSAISASSIVSFNNTTAPPPNIRSASPSISFSPVNPSRNSVVSGGSENDPNDQNLVEAEKVETVPEVVQTAKTSDTCSLGLDQHATTETNEGVDTTTGIGEASAVTTDSDSGGVNGNGSGGDVNVEELFVQMNTDDTVQDQNEDKLTNVVGETTLGNKDSSHL